MSGPVWEVIGGADAGGVVVRGGRSLDSPKDPNRLLTGSLVKQLKLEHERLYYWKVAGYGPEYGWVSTSLQGNDQLTRTDKMPWDYAVTDLALRQLEDASRQPEKAPALALLDIVRGAYSYYHQVAFQETKPTGLRMSACLGAMDELRSEMYELADMSVESFANVRDPIIEVAFEFRPSIKALSKDNGDDGLLYTHPSSKGPVLSWIRCEAKLGWPSGLLRVEEQTSYLLGKNKNGPPKRTPICSARFVQAFCSADEEQGSVEPLQGSEWEQDFKKFWAHPRDRFSSQSLNVSTLSQMYPAGRPFKPNYFKRVSWRMTHSFEDISSNLYHAKIAELLWDVNNLAGDRYLRLMDTDSEPQAMAVRFSGSMLAGAMYDICCFLQTDTKKCVYIVAPHGEEQPSQCLLTACAIYKWSGVPVDGKTLTAEDLLIINADGCQALTSYANSATAVQSSVCDISELP